MNPRACYATAAACLLGFAAAMLTASYLLCPVLLVGCFASAMAGLDSEA